VCGGEVLPERQIVGQVVDLRSIPRRRVRQPLCHAFEPVPVLARRRDGLAQPFVAVETEVIRAALHVGRADRFVERASERGDVFVENLVLEVAGARGDEHPHAGGHRGNEIRERLAGARSRFGQQRAA
jgi:hypothetical protein